MSIVTTTHVIAKQIPGPGQRMVHGRIVGPSDEQYPPGTGGPLPRRDNRVYSKEIITTRRDTHSGHTHVTRRAYEQPADGSYSTTAAHIAENDRLMAEHMRNASLKADQTPGKAILVGRPKIEDASMDAHTEEDKAAIQAQMDAYYWNLDEDDEQARFRVEHPDYTPGPKPEPDAHLDTDMGLGAGSVHEEDQTTATAEPKAQEPAPVPKGAARGPTTSKSIS